MARYDLTDCPKCRGPLSPFDRVCPFCYSRVPRHANAESPAWTLLAIGFTASLVLALVDYKLGTGYMASLRGLLRP